MNRTELLNETLYTLQSSSSDIEACTIFSDDGLVIASSMPPEMDEDHVVAMSSAMLSMGGRTVEELKRGKLEQLFVKGDKGYVICMHAGNDSSLVAIARKDTKLGLVFLDMNRAVKSICEILAS